MNHSGWTKRMLEQRQTRTPATRALLQQQPSLQAPPPRRPKELQQLLLPPVGRRLLLLHLPPALLKRGQDRVVRSLGPKADAN